MTSIRAQLLAAAALTALAAAPALAQMPTAQPGYGTVSLQAGFPDDPHSVAIRAGGALSAERLSDFCYGYVPEAPALALDYVAGDYSLYLSAASDVDTTMVVRGPDGGFSCDDDGAGFGFNPGVMFEAPQSGRYEIWVGTYSPGVGYPTAMLHISELGFQDANPFTRALNPDAIPQHSLSLRAGFADDPRTLEVTAGGDVNASMGESACFGFYSEAPSARLSYRAGRFPLFISGESDSDGTIAVRTPDGRWLCDDDSAGDLNPGVSLATPQTGDYEIWLGMLGDIGTRPSRLHISEIGFAGIDNSVDLALPARHGNLSLEGGFLPDPTTRVITAGGAVDIERAVASQTVVEGYCTGAVTREPTLELTFVPGELPLHISASADTDLTLAVNAPDGGWWCNDDGSEGVDPGLVFENAQAGVYDIYVGTFFESGEMVEGALHISELGFGPEGEIEPESADWMWDEAPANGEPIDISLEPLFGRVDLAAGFMPDPVLVAVAAGGPLDADASDGTGLEYCPGYITSAPTLEVSYDGAGPLSFYTSGDDDLTLAINLPDGSWVCDDDSGEGLNPALTIEDGAEGLYDVYVGVFFSNGEAVETQLMISEVGAPSD